MASEGGVMIIVDIAIAVLILSFAGSLVAMVILAWVIRPRDMEEPCPFCGKPKAPKSSKEF